jgi:hypothetical protein
MAFGKLAEGEVDDQPLQAAHFEVVYELDDAHEL